MSKQVLYQFVGPDQAPFWPNPDPDMAPFWPKSGPDLVNPRERSCICKVIIMSNPTRLRLGCGCVVVRLGF